MKKYLLKKYLLHKLINAMGEFYVFCSLLNDKNIELQEKLFRY